MESSASSALPYSGYFTWFTRCFRENNQD